MAQLKPQPRPKTHSIPITGHSLFVSETKPSVELQNPGLTRLELFALMNTLWTQLDAATRDKYERKADYCRRTESRRKLFAKRKRLNAPTRRFISAYSVFVSSQHERLKRTNPELTLGGRATTIAELWATMARSDKRPFINEAKRQTRRLRKMPPEEEMELSD
jgi:hypothetical protein